MKNQQIDIQFDFSNCPESGNLHLWLPDHVLARIDQRLGIGPVQTREDFGTAAILYALDSLDSEVEVTK